MVALALTSLVSRAGDDDKPVLDEAAFQKLHENAVNRQRRLIFNNDGAETALRMTEPTVDSFLAHRTTPLVGTKIDAIFYCTRSSGFGTFTHGTKIGEIFSVKEERYSNNQTEAMLKAGLDPLKLICDFTKKHDMECFWSMRMNDTHDAQVNGELLMRHSKWKQAHPELLMGTAKKKPKIGAWTAVNYGKKEVRDLAFRFFEEVCQNYDVDGIELDFLRHPVYFKSTTRGELATEEELSQMTELVKRIYAMAQKEGRKRNRPILVAIHTPDSKEYCRAMGLDIEQWMKEGLLDLWIPGGTFHQKNWDESVKLAHRYGLKVYPSLDNSRVLDELAKQMRDTPEAYHARVLTVLEVGADGANLFNTPDVFDTREIGKKLLIDLADPDKLKTLDRDYFATSQGMLHSSHKNYPLESFQEAETLNGRIPKKVTSKQAATAEMFIGEDLSQSTDAKLKLRIRCKAIPEKQSLRIELNGHAMELQRKDKEWAECEVPNSMMRPGSNQVTLSTQGKSTLTWTDALLEVRME